MKKLFSIIGKAAAGVALLATVAFGTSAAQAANITIETKVPGYGEYVLVRPELRTQLGGRVAYDKALRRYVTDRVQRGEQLKISVTPSSRAETGCRSGAILGVHASNGYYQYGAFRLPFTDTRMKVSMNPNMDNVHLRINVNGKDFEKRLPIGRR